MTHLKLILCIFSVCFIVVYSQETCQDVYVNAPDVCCKCKIGYYVNENTCVTSCNNGYYRNPVTPSNCNSTTAGLTYADDKCGCHDMNCYVCDTPNSCITCKENFFRYEDASNVTCVPDCPERYFKNYTDSSCDACNASLHFCKANDCDTKYANDLSHCKSLCGQEILIQDGGNVTYYTTCAVCDKAAVRIAGCDCCIKECPDFMIAKNGICEEIGHCKRYYWLCWMPPLVVVVAVFGISVGVFLYLICCIRGRREKPKAPPALHELDRVSNREFSEWDREDRVPVLNDIQSQEETSTTNSDLKLASPPVVDQQELYGNLSSNGAVLPPEPETPDTPDYENNIAEILEKLPRPGKLQLKTMVPADETPQDEPSPCKTNKKHKGYMNKEVIIAHEESLRRSESSRLPLSPCKAHLGHTYANSSQNIALDSTDDREAYIDIIERHNTVPVIAGKPAHTPPRDKQETYMNVDQAAALEPKQELYMDMQKGVQKLPKPARGGQNCQDNAPDQESYMDMTKTAIPKGTPRSDRKGNAARGVMDTEVPAAPPSRTPAGHSYYNQLDNKGNKRYQNVT